MAIRTSLYPSCFPSLRRVAERDVVLFVSVACRMNPTIRNRLSEKSRPSRILSRTRTRSLGLVPMCRLVTRCRRGKICLNVGEVLRCWARCVRGTQRQRDAETSRRSSLELRNAKTRVRHIARAAALDRVGRASGRELPGVQGRGARRLRTPVACVGAAVELRECARALPCFSYSTRLCVTLGGALFGVKLWGWASSRRASASRCHTAACSTKYRRSVSLEAD